MGFENIFAIVLFSVAVFKFSKSVELSLPPKVHTTNTIAIKKEFGPKYDILYGSDMSEAYFEPYRQFNSFSRTFRFPSGTIVTLTPSITIPIMTLGTQDINSLLFDFESSFTSSFPITLTFKDPPVGMVRKQDRFGYPSNRNLWSTGFSEVNPYNYSRNDVNNITQTRHNRKPRDLGFTKCSIKSLIERRIMIEKVEMWGARVLDATHDGNPKDCLLRAICEIHEIPLSREMGMLGEIVTSLFSFDKILKECTEENKLSKFFYPYAKAEKAAGKCKVYQNSCSMSIFKYV